MNVLLGYLHCFQGDVTHVKSIHSNRINNFNIPTEEMMSVIMMMASMELEIGNDSFAQYLLEESLYNLLNTKEILSQNNDFHSIYRLKMCWREEYYALNLLVHLFEKKKNFKSAIIFQRLAINASKHLQNDYNVAQCSLKHRNLEAQLNQDSQ